MIRRARIAVAALVLGAAALARPAAGDVERARSRPLPEVVPAGPRALDIPAGAAVAETEAELAAMLADGAGPREIWLRPRVYRGDLAVRRAVAIHGATGAVVEGGGASTVISIESSDVTIDNVIVRRSGRRHTAEDAGVKAKGDRVRLTNLRVEDTLFGISLELCHGCLIEGTHIEGPGDRASKSRATCSRARAARPASAWASRRVTRSRSAATGSSRTDAAWQKTVTDEQLKKTILYGGAAVGKSPMMPASPDLEQKPEMVEALVKVVR